MSPEDTLRPVRYQICLLSAPSAERVTAGGRGDASQAAMVNGNAEYAELLALWILTQEFIVGESAITNQKVRRDWLAYWLYPTPIPTEQKLTMLQKAVDGLHRIIGIRSQEAFGKGSVEREKPGGSRPVYKRERSTVELSYSGIAVDVVELKHAFEQRDYIAVERIGAAPLLEGANYRWLQDPLFQKVRARCDSYCLTTLLHRANDLLALIQHDAPDSLTPHGLQQRKSAIPLLDIAAERFARYGWPPTQPGQIADLWEQFRCLCGWATYWPLPPPGVPGEARIVLTSPASAPPPAAAPSPELRRAGRLPQITTSFVGREKEIREIAARLSAYPVVTLVGTGGCGKTRLAVRMASELHEQFADGAWFVDLSSVKESGEVAVAVTVGITGYRDSNGDPVAALQDLLRNRQVLLILDNCEQAVAGCAALAHSLSSSCPGLKILATSREDLCIDTGSRIDVPLLTAHEASHLFVERARMYLPAFDLPGHEKAIEQICRRLDRLPLAIELAAGRIDTLTLAQISSRLTSDRFGLLRNATRLVTDRQKTLEATIEWSYGLLTGPEKSLLARLAVFAGAFTIQDAEAVCQEEGEESIIDRLTVLRRSSLIQMEQDSHEGRRFSLLESIRAFSLRQLAARPDAGETRTRHLVHSTALAERLVREAGRDGKDAAARRLQEEWRTNLRESLEWSLTLTDAIPGLNLAGLLGSFMFRQGFNRSGSAFLERLLAKGSGLRTATYVRAARAAGNLCLQRDDLDQAEIFYGKCLEIDQELNDQAGVARDYGSLANILLARDRVDEARTNLELSLAISEQLGDVDLIGRTLDNLSTVAFKNDLPGALGYQYRSLDLFKGIGDRHNMALPHNNLAYTHLALHQEAEAAAHLLESIALCRDSIHVDEMLHGLFVAGVLWSRRGGMETAAVLIGGERAQRSVRVLPRCRQAEADDQECEVSGRKQLGDAEWDHHLDRGARMTLDQLSAYALEALSQIQQNPRRL